MSDTPSRERVTTLYRRRKRVVRDRGEVTFPVMCASYCKHWLTQWRSPSHLGAFTHPFIGCSYSCNDDADVSGPAMGPEKEAALEQIAPSLCDTLSLASTGTALRRKNHRVMCVCWARSEGAIGCFSVLVTQHPDTSLGALSHPPPERQGARRKFLLTPQKTYIILTQNAD